MSDLTLSSRHSSKFSAVRDFIASRWVRSRADVRACCSGKDDACGRSPTTVRLSGFSFSGHVYGDHIYAFSTLHLNSYSQTVSIHLPASGELKKKEKTLKRRVDEMEFESSLIFIRFSSDAGAKEQFSKLCFPLKHPRAEIPADGPSPPSHTLLLRR